MWQVYGYTLIRQRIIILDCFHEKPITALGFMESTERVLRGDRLCTTCIKLHTEVSWSSAMARESEYLIMASSSFVHMDYGEA